MASLEVNLNLPPGGQPGGQPGQSGGAVQPGATPDAGRPPSPDWDVMKDVGFGPLMTPAREALKDYAAMVDKDREEWARQYDETFSSLHTAADQAKEMARRDQQAFDKRMAVMRERFDVESAATVAARQWEEEAALRERSLDVLKEKHQIEGAATEEARLQLAAQKEDREWAEKVNAAKREQDPGEATGEDLGALGGLLSQAGLGSMGRLFQMAPKLQEQLGLFGKPAAEKGDGGALAKAQQAAKQMGQAGKMAEGGEAAEGAAGGAEGAAAGGLGGMAAMAGPIGAALALGMEGQKMLTDAVEGAAHAIAGLGNEASRFVRDDYFEAFAAGFEGFESVAESVPIFGDTIKAANDVLLAFPRALVAVQDSFYDMGERVKGFSASINAAQAEAQVRTMLGDIREANQMGEGIARMEDAQNRATESLRELSGPLKQLLLEVSSIPVEVLAELIGNLRDMARDSGALRVFTEGIKDVFAGIRAWLDLKGQNGEGDPDLEITKEFIEHMGRFVPHGRAPAEAPDARLRAPLQRGGF